MAIITICRILTSLIILYSGETSYELYSIGCQLELDGRIKEAIEYYRRALELDSRSPDIYSSLANAFYKIRKYDDGIEYAKQGSLIAPENSQSYVTIAVGHIGKGDFKKAVEFYQKALKYDPRNPEIYSAISTIYEVMGDLNMARQTLKDIPQELKTSEILTRLGTISGKAGDHKTAIDYYQEAYAMDTTNVTALIGVGTGFDFLEMKDSSVYYYEKVIVYDTFPAVSKRLVDLYSDTDQFEKLISVAGRILSKGYYEVGVRRSLGYALYKTGALTESLDEFLITSHLDPNDTYSRFYVARIYLDQGKYDEAQREIGEALKINPDFVELWIYLGFAAIDKNDYETANHAFTEAARRGGDLTQIYYLLGVTAEMERTARPVSKGQDLYNNAYCYYKKSLSVNPKGLPTLEALANLCQRINREDEALRTFKRVIELDTTNAVALNYVGYAFAERNESLAYALQLIDRALAVETNNGYYIDSRGWVFYQMAKYDEALAELKRASEIVEDEVILEHLGDVYLKLDDPTHAQEAYEKVLKIAPNNKNLRMKLKKIEGNLMENR